MTNQAWLVSVRRGVYTALPIVDGDGQPELQVPGFHQSGIMTVQPCLWYSGELVGQSVWRGYPVEVWRCANRESEAVNQFYSTDWRIVVREETAKGAIAELRDLREREFTEGWFAPDRKLRGIGFVEFVKGVGDLSSYSDGLENQ